jgi:glyoxylase-like metal-dependent hydrolase (beta-lactamase superfamily II)
MSLHAIIPGTLWGATGWLRADARPVSWIPPGLPGFLPVTAYALRDGAEWMVVDTGLPLHGPQIEAALAQTIAGTTHRRMINTRREQDCMANIGPLVRRFGIAEVPYVGVLNPVEMTDVLENDEAEARIAAMAPVRAVRIEVGQAVAVGRLRLEPLRVQLRLLATNWFFEHATRTLFTSDSFGFLTRATPDAPLVRAPEEAPIDAGDIARMLSAKFDWLIGIDPAPILADLDAIFSARRVDRLCPGHGCVIEGSDAVAEALARMQEAIAMLAARPKPPIDLPAFLKETA